MTEQQPSPETVAVRLEQFDDAELAALRTLADERGLDLSGAVVVAARRGLTGGGVHNVNTGTVSGTHIQAGNIEGGLSL